MEIANLILEFLKVLVWPLLILFIIVFFKSEIVSLLEKMIEINVGGENGFNLKLRTAQRIAEKESTNAISHSRLSKQSSLILSLPDESFLYLNSLVHKSIKSTYYPSSGKELRALNSLAEHGIMKQKSMSEFELTEIGGQLFASMQNL